MTAKLSPAMRRSLFILAPWGVEIAEVVGNKRTRDALYARGLATCRKIKGQVYVQITEAGYATINRTPADTINYVWAEVEMRQRHHDALDAPVETPSTEASHLTPAASRRAIERLKREVAELTESRDQYRAASDALATQNLKLDRIADQVGDGTQSVLARTIRNILDAS